MFSSNHATSDVVAFLGTRFDRVSDVQPIEGGEWSQAFSFRAANRDLVVRFGSHVEDYEKDRRAMRFVGPDLPIPEILEIGEAFDDCYAVSARRYGAPLDHLDADGLRRALPSIFRMFDALRGADIAGTSGYGMWAPDGNAPFASWREFLLAVNADPQTSRIHGWRATLEARPADLAVFDAGYRQLEALSVHLPEQRYLMHSDLVGDNVRVDADEVTAVVDWANAMYGDFLYDLARLTFWVPWYPAWHVVDIVGAARAHYESIGLEVPRFEERLRACQIYVGLEAQPYNVFTSRWDELARSGQRTLELARP